MRLTVRHTTRYRYETPLANAMQQLRLTPEDGPSQRVVEWSIEAPGIERATTYKDAFGNQVHMVSRSEPIEDVEITASGIVETTDTNGILGHEPMPASHRGSTQGSLRLRNPTRRSADWRPMRRDMTRLPVSML